MLGLGRNFARHHHGLLKMAALLAALSLGACGGGTNRIDVDRSATLTAQPASFVVLPVKGQEKAADYTRYADQITAHLTAKGLTRVDNAANARYGLMFSYDGDGLTGALEDRRRGYGEKKSDADKTVRTASITVYDLTRPHWPDEVVFGGTAHCLIDVTNHDPKVIAAVIDAILKDFPGAGRETFSVDLSTAK